MNEAIAQGKDGVVSWEANGGFLLGTSFQVNGHDLPALPTRDAVLPILAALLLKRARGRSMSALFATLPARATQAGLIDDFPVERSRGLLSRLLPADRSITLAEFRDGGVALTRAPGQVSVAGPAADDVRERRQALLGLLAPPGEFGDVVQINYLDGVRARFANGDVIHLRPSGNAPQMRVYAVSDTQDRADALVHLGIEALSRPSAQP
jgi:phosphomannomutase